MHVCLWMAARFSFLSVLTAALLMPASRYFYTTCLAMFLLPLAVAGHAAVFVRGAWRRLWFVIPILAFGLVAWWYHLTLLLGVLNGGHFEFRHPAQIYGGTAWTRQGDFSQASTLDLLRLQAASMSEGLTRTVRDMTYETTNSFGHWYMRAQMNPHPTTMNVGIVVLLALGLGYLLGQLRDPRAWMLLVWLGISLLPGIMSRDATPRRMSMLFPAAHVIGILFVAAFVRAIRQGAGRRTADVATGAAAVALAIVILTNTVSHFRMPLQPVIFADYSRFLRPILRQSDTVFLNLPRPFISLLQFEDVDRFVTAPWCLQGVDHDSSWLRVGLEPQCTFGDEAYSLTFTPAGDRRGARRPPHAADQLRVLRRADDPGRARPHPRALPERADAGVRQPARPAPPGGGEHRSRRQRRPARAAAAQRRVAAAGRARRRQRACRRRGRAAAAGGDDRGRPVAGQRQLVRLRPAAALSGRGPARSAAPTPRPTCRAPLLAGVHPFTLSIPDPSACTLPLQVTVARPDSAPGRPRRRPLHEPDGGGAPGRGGAAGAHLPRLSRRARCW